MVRKRKKKAQPSPGESLSDEFVDHIVSTSDACGLVASTTESQQWNEVSKVTVLLGTLIEREQEKEEEKDRDKIGSASDLEAILNIEIIMSDLHRDCARLVATTQSQPEPFTWAQFHRPHISATRTCAVVSLVASLSESQSFQGLTAKIQIYQMLNDFSLAYREGYEKKIRSSIQEYSEYFSHRCLPSPHHHWMNLVLKYAVTASEYIEVPFYQNYNSSIRERIKNRASDQDEGTCAKNASTRNKDCSSENHQNSKNHLIFGPNGFGKTRMCNEFEEAHSQQKVLRPCLPHEVIEGYVGGMESSIIGLYACAHEPADAGVNIILDDVDSLWDAKSNEDGDSGQGRPHISRRAFSTVLDILSDSQTYGPNAPLIQCTSTKNFAEQVGRFDEVYQVSQMSATQRRDLISEAITPKPISYIDQIPEIQVQIESFVELTTGLSYSELSSMCREAIRSTSFESHNEIANGSCSPQSILSQLFTIIQQRKPTSLSNWMENDVIGLRIFSERELRKEFDAEPTGKISDFPLEGKAANNAWKEMQRAIVIPLCRSQELCSLLCSDASSPSKSFCGGVLLTGQPGCGKTTIARYCALVAASIRPSVKLVETNCTAFIHKEVGRSEQSIAEMFRLARQASPCILLLEGIESIAAVRGNDNTTEGTMDRLLSTLLTELDGVGIGKDREEDTDGGIAVIGITADKSWIDPALRRPGRLERTISIGLPDLSGRESIVKKQLEMRHSLLNVTPENIASLSSAVARLTEGLIAASVVAVCEKAIKCYYLEHPAGRMDESGTSIELRHFSTVLVPSV